MKKLTSKLTIHMVTSLDGFVAKPDGDVSWMQSSQFYAPGIELNKEYIDSFLSTIDCYLMGSKTYELALELGWAYGNLPVFVLSNRKLEVTRPSVQLLSGDLVEIISDLKSNYKHIWMAGGSSLTKDCLTQGVADTINVSIVPILLGGGMLFFDFIDKEIPLHLKNVTTFRNGMVEIEYGIVKT